jgi:hypothetical protein
MISVEIALFLEIEALRQKECLVWFAESVTIGGQCLYGARFIDVIQGSR